MMGRKKDEIQNNMDDARFIEIMTAIYGDLPRQGPGSDATTIKVLGLCKNLAENITALDLGCGTGTHTITLAQHINGTIIALDMFAPFITTLQTNAAAAGVSDKIQAQTGDMGDLPFEKHSIDLIWSEAAAYSIGIANALAHWHPFIKPGGYLAVSELVWLTDDPPEEVRAFWAEEYPDMQPAAAISALFGTHGYTLVDTVTLPDADWWAYYDPQVAKLPALHAQFADDEAALAVVKGIETEIDMRRRFGDYYGYQFFIAQPV